MDSERPRLSDALRLVYIVDREAARDWQRLDAVLEAGVTCLWLRAPTATGAQLHRSARDLVWRCRERGAALVIGDRADVALAADADGVQLGYRSPSPRKVRPWFDRWLGVSCHTEDDLRRARELGADYAVLSPVYGVPDKGAPLGAALFQRMQAAVELPVVALGGIEPTNVAELGAGGATGVAVIRALRDAADPGAAARALAGAVTPS